MLPEVPLPRRQVQLGRGPVELVGDLRVGVGAAADAVVRVGEQVRVGERRGPGGAGGVERLGGELPVVGAVQAGGLRGRRRQVEGRRGGRRVEFALLRVVARQQRQPGPLLVVDLVVRHSGQRLSVRHLHLQQELQLPAGLVEDVGHLVAALGDVERTVAELRGLPGAGVQRALVGAEQLPGGDAAVDDVLAVISGVVPAAGDVEGVVAHAGLAGHLGVAPVGRRAHVSGGAAVAGAESVADRGAAALRVVVLRGVQTQPLVGGRADVEGAAGLTVGDQRVALAALLVPAEVDRVDVLPGGGVDAARLAPAVGDDPSGVVLQLPGQPGGGVRDERGVLRSRRQVGDLVDPYPRPGVRHVRLGRHAAQQGHVVHAEPPGVGCTAELEAHLSLGGVDGRGEGVRVGVARDAQLRADLVVGVVRGHRQADDRPDHVVGGRTGGREGELVRLPGDQGDVVLAEGRVPAVGGAAGGVGAQPAVGHGGGDVAARPPGIGAVVEGAVPDLLGLLGTRRGGGQRGDGRRQQGRQGDERGSASFHVRGSSGEVALAGNGSAPKCGRRPCLWQT